MGTFKAYIPRYNLMNNSQELSRAAAAATSYFDEFQSNLHWYPFLPYKQIRIVSKFQIISTQIKFTAELNKTFVNFGLISNARDATPDYSCLDYIPLRCIHTRNLWIRKQVSWDAGTMVWPAVALCSDGSFLRDQSLKYASPAAAVDCSPVTYNWLINLFAIPHNR